MGTDEVCERCDNAGRHSHNPNRGHMVNVSSGRAKRTFIYVCDTCGYVQIIGPKRKGAKHDALIFSGMVDLRLLPRLSYREMLTN